ncbi:MAG: VOC family protein [Acidimicrobiales bacterium]
MSVPLRKMFDLTAAEGQRLPADLGGRGQEMPTKDEAGPATLALALVVRRRRCGGKLSWHARRPMHMQVARASPSRDPPSSQHPPKAQRMPSDTKPERYEMAELPPPPEGIVLAHFIVSDDVERSRRFYTEVLGGRVAFSGPGGLTYVALANSWIIINVGGSPTDDKPEVTLEAPGDPDRVSSFLNIRVKDIDAVYTEWSARGAHFLTPPKQHEYEIRCYIRDPDGHLIEVGQTTDPEGDWTPDQWPSSTPAEESE